jgi:hypothetical protein
MLRVVSFARAASSATFKIFTFNNEDLEYFVSAKTCGKFGAGIGVTPNE